MTKSFGNSVKKEANIPLHIKRENVPEESTASSDNESPIKTVRILKLLILVSPALAAARASLGFT